MTKGQARGITGPLRIAFGIIKGISILAGLFFTIICLMAAVGAFTANFWARLVVGLVVGLGVPLFVADRLLPEDKEKGRGIPSDLLAVVYVAVPLVFAGPAHGLTSNILAVEGDRLAAAGWSRTGAVAYWLARVKPEGATKTARKKPKRKPDDKPKAKASKGKEKATAGAGKGAGKDKGKTKVAAKPDAGASDVTAKKTPTEYTPAELFRKCAPSVVNIKVGSGGGTGFLIDDRGTIATNSHVIHNATSVEIKLKDGVWIREVDLLVENKEADLALLRVKHSKLPEALPLGNSDKTAVGDKVIAIGNPLGLEHTLTDGLISQRRVYKGRRWLQISVPISPGNSGGPLFNLKGEVVGVTTAAFSAWTGAQNLNLAVPVNELKKLIKDSYPKRKAIGSNKPQTW
jgi:hypothetical protein